METSILETQRLRVRRFTPEDAPFMLALLNDPGWKANIGDRGVRTVEAARDYIQTRMLAMYARHGYGMWLLEMKDSAEPVGTVGIVRRDGLDHADLGFALLENFTGHGYALEASRAVLDYARHPLAITKMLAIVVETNRPSIRLLEKLGFRRAGSIRLPGGEDDLELYEVG